MVMTAGAAREDRLEKSSEQLPDAAAGDTLTSHEEGEGDYGGETEPFSPKEPIQIKNSSLTGVNYFNYHDNWRRGDTESLGEGSYSHSATTTERSRFQRISLASPHEVRTLPRSVGFRTTG